MTAIQLKRDEVSRDAMPVPMTYGTTTTNDGGTTTTTTTTDRDRQGTTTTTTTVSRDRQDTTTTTSGPAKTQTPGGDEPDEGRRPVLLDLDGNGITITERSKSSVYMDGGDGKEHRTAWAGAGDGVLFFDAGGDGRITEKREYVFTEWTQGSTSDLEAVRERFDSNGNGRLTSADAQWARFKVAPKRKRRGLNTKRDRNRNQRAKALGLAFNCKRSTMTIEEDIRNAETRAWRRVISASFLAITLLPSVSHAESGLVVNMLNKSAGLITDVQHYCPPRRAAEGIAGYALTNEKYLPEDFGSASDIRMTRHMYRTARTDAKDVAIVVGNLEPRSKSNNCSAIMIIDSNGAPVRIKPSFMDGNYLRHFSPDVRAAVTDLAQLCENLGDRAPAYFSGSRAGTLMENGEVVIIPETFFCEGEVKNALSSIDVTLGKATIRVSIVYNKIFLQEITK